MNFDNFLSTARTKLNFGLPGIKAILSESAFLIELVNSFSLALDLSLNPEITFLLVGFSVSLYFCRRKKYYILNPFFFSLFWLGLSGFFVWLWSPLPLNWTIAIKKISTVAVVDGRHWIMKRNCLSVPFSINSGRG